MRTFKSIAISISLCLLPVVASAEQATNRAFLKRFCTTDYRAHCPAQGKDFMPDMPEAMACFRIQARALSPNCSAAIAIYDQDQSVIRRVSALR